MAIKYDLSKVHPEPGDILLFNLKNGYSQVELDHFCQEVSTILPEGVGAVFSYDRMDVYVLNKEINQIQLFKE